MTRAKLPKQTLLYEWSWNTQHEDSNAGRISLTEAAVPDREHIRIELEYFNHLKTIQQS